MGNWRKKSNVGRLRNCLTPLKMESLFNSVAEYLYLEYAVAIMIVTEMVRYLVPGIDKKVQPKFVVLIVASMLSIPGYLLYQDTFNLFKSMTSFAFAVIGYDYVWKPLKAKFFPGIDEKQRV